MTSIKWTKLSDWGSWEMFGIKRKESLEQWITQQDIESIDHQPPRSTHSNFSWEWRLRPVCYNLEIVHRRPGGRLDRHRLSMELSNPTFKNRTIFPDLQSLLLYPVGVLHKSGIIIPEDWSMFTLRTWTDNLKYKYDYNLEWYKYDYNFITWNNCRYSVHTYPYTTNLLDDDHDETARKGDTVTYYGLKIRQIPAITPLGEIYVQRWTKLSPDLWKLVLMFLKKPPSRPGPIRF